MIAPAKVLEPDGHGGVQHVIVVDARRVEDAWGAAVQRVTKGVDGEQVHANLVPADSGEIGEKDQRCG